MENKLLNGFNDGLNASSGTGRNYIIEPISLEISEGLQYHIDFVESTKIAFGYYSKNLLNMSKKIMTREDAEIKTIESLKSIGVEKSIFNAAFYDYAKRVLIELLLKNNTMDYKLFDQASLNEGIDKRIHLDPIVEHFKESDEYSVNFDVFKSDCFIDELNNFYHESGKNKIKLISGEKREDNPKKLFFMYNLHQIR